MANTPEGPPEGATATTVTHRVAFYETDAMGIVHHANYVRFLELARVQWMDDHHRPYGDYIARDLHLATTRVEVDYAQPSRFDDMLSVTAWMTWVRGASLRMSYELTSASGLVATAATEHAAVDGEGNVRRIPKEDRLELKQLAAGPPD